MDIGKVLVIIGIAFIIFGLLYMLGFGRLPGDVNIQTKGISISIPIISSLILSIILTLLLNLWLKR